MLIVGGMDASGNGSAAAEVYDPTTGVFTLAGRMNDERTFNTETLVGGGAVFVAGGFGVGLVTLSSTENYTGAGFTHAHRSARSSVSPMLVTGSSKSAARIRKLALTAATSTMP